MILGARRPTLKTEPSTRRTPDWRRDLWNRDR